MFYASPSMDNTYGVLSANKVITRINDTKFQFEQTKYGYTTNAGQTVNQLVPKMIIGYRYKL